VSADTLVYFGVLDDVLAGAAQALRPQGSFIFTVERADDADAPDGHRINPHGRYSHTRGYVERTLANAGFAGVQIENDVLRQEGGLPVNGLVVTAAKGRVNAVESDHAR
jgi:predicted TPR repeat methyltransferase